MPSPAPLPYDRRAGEGGDHSLALRPPMLLSLSHTTTTTIHAARRAIATPAALTRIGVSQPDPGLSTDQPPTAAIRTPPTMSATPSPSATHSTSLTRPPSPQDPRAAGSSSSG